MVTHNLTVYVSKKAKNKIYFGYPTKAYKAVTSNLDVEDKFTRTITRKEHLLIWLKICILAKNV